MTGFIVNVFPFRNRVSYKEAFEGLELGEGKPSRPVLRGPGGRKAAWLLGSQSMVRLIARQRAKISSRELSFWIAEVTASRSCGLVSIWCPVCRVPGRFAGILETIENPAISMCSMSLRRNSLRLYNLRKTARKNSASAQHEWN